MSTKSIVSLAAGTAVIAGAIAGAASGAIAGAAVVPKDSVEENNEITWFLAGIATGIAIGFTAGVIVSNKRKRRQSVGEPSTPSPGPIPPSQEQCSFVQERVETYRDEMLCYELDLEYNRREASRDVLQKLLDGRKEVLAWPVLYLNSDEWRWKQQQLQKAVEGALDKLNLQAPQDVREPTTQAARACEQWAKAEAKRLFDEELGAG